MISEREIVLEGDFNTKCKNADHLLPHGMMCDSTGSVHYQVVPKISGSGNGK